MNSCEITAGVTALANCIAKNLGDSELALVAAAFVELGDKLALLSAHRQQCRDKKEQMME